ncbi:diaminopimelate epimerase [Agitococcus lubricus]|uniref:Diaminopimelate epimerase n=1 Tax=Agitococcus lubricus TaxID=1077255 RepID=A0A2T5IWP6_9GAMM|nr:diaminopimelate epimerase [Agitococcus lubricus]PTQ88376.1 diaminopimelate epimerase [Agitococcus lubricus]
MRLEFTKMHGLGNDFVVIDCISQRARLDTHQIKQIADRHFGVGFDQLLLVEAPTRPDVDFRYRIFNADGSEVQQCGNGARCFARFVRDRKLSRKTKLIVETASGIIELNIAPNGWVRVNMGVPRLEPNDIPFIASARALTYPLDVSDHIIEISAVSMGNPHAVILVDNVNTAPVREWGRIIENHPRFPERVNVGFLEIIDRQRAKLRVFERGSGETLACGTGTCAAVVAGIQQGLLDERVRVQLRGGELDIRWQGEGHPVWMTGPTARVFDGVLRLYEWQ